MLICVKGHSQGWQEEGELGWTVLISSSIRESPRGQREELSSYAWDTLEVTSWKWMACVYKISGKKINIIPAWSLCKEIPEKVGDNPAKQNRGNTENHTMLNPSCQRPGSFCCHSADPVRNSHGHILRVRWQPGHPDTSLCSGRGLVPAAVASACLTQCITSQSGSEENHKTKPQ